MTTQQNLPQRNTAESHERICQESMVSRYIHDADCCREGNAFVLFSLPRELPGLFNVRFTAPADFTPGDIFTVKGQNLAVRTRLMEEPAGVLFAAGAVVRCDVDMEQGLVFVTAGGEAQGGGGNAFSPAPPLMDGTAAAGTATTQLATTEFVATAIEEADGAPSARSRWCRTTPRRIRRTKCRRTAAASPSRQTGLSWSRGTATLPPGKAYSLTAWRRLALPAAFLRLCQSRLATW